MSAQSLRDYLRAQREDRVRRAGSKLIIPIPGYEERLAGRYRILTFDDKVAIANRHGGVELDPGDTSMAADYIVNACEELLEVTGTGEDGQPTYQGLGMQWMADDIADLFGVAVTSQSHTAVQALREALDSDQIVDHLAAIATGAAGIMAQVEKQSEGEPEPAAAG
jgi:hypothetical protein